MSLAELLKGKMAFFKEWKRRIGRVSKLQMASLSHFYHREDDGEPKAAEPQGITSFQAH